MEFRFILLRKQNQTCTNYFSIHKQRCSYCGICLTLDWYARTQWDSMGQKCLACKSRGSAAYFDGNEQVSLSHIQKCSLCRKLKGHLPLCGWLRAVVAFLKCSQCIDWSFAMKCCVEVLWRSWSLHLLYLQNQTKQTGMDQWNTKSFYLVHIMKCIYL